ncbi:diguanylate cyclase [Desulfosporosinus sp. SB140]|uniref:histidine kinase N-terminal 7TM domain-containing diguanylate cyclase n=1 Tax=Desulfosporosinus paludis TaxID=3115649 RepID=UPI00388E0935
MNHIADMYSLLLFISTIIAVGLSIYSIKSSPMPGSKYFAILCGSVAIFSFGYGMELQSESLKVALFWNKFQYLSGPFIGLFAFFLAADYTGNKKLLKSKARIIVLLLIPFSITIIRYTNDFHHLYYTSVLYTSNGFFNILIKNKGPLFTYYMLYLSFIMIYSSVIYLKTIFNSSSINHVPISIMIIASLLPWLSIYMNISNTAPFGIDYSAILLCPSAILYMFGIFKFRMLRTIPIARNTVFHHSKDGIIILDYNENIIDYNEAAVLIFDQLTDKYLHQKIYNLLPELMERGTLRGENESFDFSFTKSGIEHYYSLENIRLNTENDYTLGWIFIISDITKLVNNQKRFEVYATIDDLTNIYNRRFFIELFNQEINSAKKTKDPLCLIMYDIDFFKNINDKYGHQAGDEILRYVVATSKACIRATDIVARYGGDEFMILLPETKIDDAIALAERIRSQLEMGYCIYDNHKINITSSFGVTGFENYTTDLSVEVLINEVDKTLYQGKSSGRNKVTFRSLTQATSGS